MGGGGRGRAVRERDLGESDARSSRVEAVRRLRTAEGLALDELRVGVYLRVASVGFDRDRRSRRVSGCVGTINAEMGIRCTATGEPEGRRVYRNLLNM